MTTPEEAARTIAMDSEAVEAARRITAFHSGYTVSIPSGTNDALTVARALLASTAREAKLREALENIEDIATTGRISELVEKFNTMKLIAREALADKETT
jgi:electron transfer flavoprotein alpha/beta subunit